MRAEIDRSSMSCEVIVVGAGPAGSTAARELARRGYDVVLADENPAPRQTVVCTGIVGREAFEEFDLPSGAVVDTLRTARFVSPAGSEVRYRPGRPMARVVDRTAFDTALANRAGRAGASLLRGHAARTVEKDHDGVVVGFEVEGEGRREIRGRALVVATGYRRWLHRAAGLGVPSGYVHGVHADLRMDDLEGAELYFGEGVAPGWFAWAIPFGNETARLGVLADQGAPRLFWRFLRRPDVQRRLGLDADRDEERRAIEAALRSRAIVQGAVEPSYADRTVAVGEAAGQVKTTTAGGIYYGMIGAEIAADVLSHALALDRLGASELAGYEESWHARLSSEIEGGLQLQRVARSMRDQEIDHLFDALRDGLGSAVRAAIHFDWHRPALKVLFSRGGLGRRLRKRLSRAAFS